VKYEHNKNVICIEKGKSIKGLKNKKKIIEYLICKLFRMNHKERKKNYTPNKTSVLINSK